MLANSGFNKKELLLLGKLLVGGGINVDSATLAPSLRILGDMPLKSELLNKELNPEAGGIFVSDVWCCWVFVL